ncbi:SlyX family protein [Tistrella bauzanensis]|nr:SlyX family protein [Tistrella bauzanensis]
MSGDDAAERLMALEERLAHLERALDDASAEIIRQDRLVGALSLRLRRLERSMAEGGGGHDGGGHGDDDHDDAPSPFMP